jgi:hypothetical protein
VVIATPPTRLTASGFRTAETTRPNLPIAVHPSPGLPGFFTTHHLDDAQAAVDFPRQVPDDGNLVVWTTAASGGDLPLGRVAQLEWPALGAPHSVRQHRDRHHEHDRGADPHKAGFFDRPWIRQPTYATEMLGGYLPHMVKRYSRQASVARGRNRHFQAISALLFWPFRGHE